MQAPNDQNWLQKFRDLESVALESAYQGRTLPREIYALPFRSQVDWTLFPDWARPVDPEMFQETGHEG
jgi:hypothetical protein